MNKNNEQQWADIMRTVQDTNTLTKETLQKNVAFYGMPLEVLKPNFEHPLLAFTQLVSFAYMLLVDKDNILSGKNLTQFRSFVPTLQTDLNLINDLRTHFQHYVFTPKQGAKDWFMEITNVPKHPTSNDNWELCTAAFLDCFEKTAESIHEALRTQNSQLQEDKEPFISGWSAIHNENVLNDIDFHAIFREARVIFGLPHLDTPKFVNHNKKGWETGLKNFKGGNVKQAVIMLMVQTLVQQIKDKKLSIPLMPGEVGTKYGIEGRVIQEYYIEAYRIYLECDQDQEHTLILQTVWQKMDEFHQQKTR
jgi:hypothetical protein